MVGTKSAGSHFNLTIAALVLAGVVFTTGSHSAELTPYVVSGANSRVEFEEAHTDDEDEENSNSGKGIELKFGISLIVGANFGNVDIIDSVELTDAGTTMVKDSDGEDFAAMFYLHRRNYRGCRDLNACFGWGPYVGHLAKPTGGLGGGWSFGVMGGFDHLPGAVGFGYVVRQDIRYLVTDTETGLPEAAEGDFEGFAVTLGFSF